MPRLHLFRRPALRTLTAIAFTAAASACSEESGPAPMLWESSTEQIGDTIVVRTLSGQVWPASATLVPEVSIGELDGPLEYILGQVAAIGRLPTGEIIVIDRQAPAIHVYEADGIYRMTLGREGSGPGEYRRPEALAIANGEIAVRDPANARIARFGSDGEYVDQWTINGSFSTSHKMYTDRLGNVYSPTTARTGTDVVEWAWVLIRYSAERGVVDTLPAPTADLPKNTVEGRREGSSSQISVPYTARDYWSYSPEGYFVQAISSRYGVKLLKGGEPHVLIEKSYEPVPVHPEDASRERQRIENDFRSRFPGWRWNGPEIPDTKPPFHGVSVGTDGRIWVRLHTESVEVDNPDYDPTEEGSHPTRFVSDNVYDVFEADGRYLGQVNAPREMSRYPEPVFGPDWVLAVTADDLGVQRVVRYRIEVGNAGTD